MSKSILLLILLTPNLCWGSAADKKVAVAADTKEAAAGITAETKKTVLKRLEHYSDEEKIYAACQTAHSTQDLAATINNILTGTVHYIPGSHGAYTYDSAKPYFKQVEHKLDGSSKCWTFKVNGSDDYLTIQYDGLARAWQTSTAHHGNMVYTEQDIQFHEGQFFNYHLVCQTKHTYVHKKGEFFPENKEITVLPSTIKFHSLTALGKKPTETQAVATTALAATQVGANAAAIYKVFQLLPHTMYQQCLYGACADPAETVNLSGVMNQLLGAKHDPSQPYVTQIAHELNGSSRRRTFQVHGTNDRLTIQCDGHTADNTAVSPTDMNNVIYHGQIKYAEHRKTLEPGIFFNTQLIDDIEHTYPHAQASSTAGEPTHVLKSRTEKFHSLPGKMIKPFLKGFAKAFPVGIIAGAAVGAILLKCKVVTPATTEL